MVINGIKRRYVMKRSILTVISFVLCIIMSLSACGNGKSTAEKANPASDFEYHTNGDYVVIDKYIGNDDTVVIPGKIEKLTVKIIGQDSFKSTNIVSVSIPDSIETIWIEAFAECQNLKDINFGTGLIEIGNQAFRDCDSLEVLKLPQGVKYVDNIAVKCKSLKEVFIPKSILEWPGSFVDCESLVTVNIEEGILNIDDCAFLGASALEIITIPASVTKIEYGAFGRCDSLKKIYFKGNAPEFDSYIFGLSNKSVTIYYNKNTTGWDDILSSGDYVLETY